MREAFQILRASLSMCLGLLLALLFGSVLISAFKLYSNLYFTSDGFHYYSFLRNIANHWLFREGPTFEYLLGNHSYLTMLMLAPIIKVFQTPFVLLAVNVSSHFLTGIFLGLCWLEIDKSGARFLAAIALGIGYATFPMIMEGYFAGEFLFQPDFLLAPLITLLLLATLKNQYKLFLACSGLIILTKEEYIVMFPFIVIFVLHLSSMTQNKKFTRNQLLGMFAVYAATSIISLVSLYTFRSMNDVNHAVRSVYYFDKIMNLHTWISFIPVLLERALPLSPLLLLLLLNPLMIQPYVFVFYALAFFVGRLLLNEVIYNSSLGTKWGNVIIVPTLFMAALGLLAYALQRKHFMHKSVCWLCSLASLVWVLTISIQSPSALGIWYLATNGIGPKLSPEDVASIRAKIPKAEQAGYIIMSEFLMAPFMDRSHVSEGWVMDQAAARQQQILQHADFIILRKNGAFAQTLLGAPKEYLKVAETESLLCLQPRLHLAESKNSNSETY